MTITLAVGLPGSGKSTYFAKRGIRPICPDDLRHLILDDATRQDRNQQIHDLALYLAEQRLMASMEQTYIDATNLKRWQRQIYIDLANAYGAKINAIWFDMPLWLCLLRNERRKRRVPREVIRRMANTFEPPNYDEGFDLIDLIEDDDEWGNIDF